MNEKNVIIRQSSIRGATRELIGAMVQKGWLKDSNQIVAAIGEVRASLERLEGEINPTATLLFQMVLSGNFTMRQIINSIVSVGVALTGETVDGKI